MVGKPTDDSPNTPSQPSEGIPAPSGAANLIDTDYVIGQDNIKGEFSFSLDIHGKVFIISAATILLFVILTLALQNEVEPLFSSIRNWLTSHLAWLFMSIVNRPGFSKHLASSLRNVFQILPVTADC